jgi:ElaB/YqjD/DUF883 family membrane-anchored ribosome-binding protein
MDPSKEESLLSELRHISGRLTDVMTNMGDDASGPGERIAAIRADLDELRSRMEDHASGKP